MSKIKETVRAILYIVSNQIILIAHDIYGEIYIRKRFEKKNLCSHIKSKHDHNMITIKFNKSCW